MLENTHALRCSCTSVLLAQAPVVKQEPSDVAVSAAQPQAVAASVPSQDPGTDDLNAELLQKFRSLRQEYYYTKQELDRRAEHITMLEGCVLPSMFPTS